MNQLGFIDIDVINDDLFLLLPKYIQDRNFELSEDEYLELDKLDESMLDLILILMN